MKSSGDQFFIRGEGEEFVSAGHVRSRGTYKYVRPFSEALRFMVARCDHLQRDGDCHGGLPSVGSR